MTVFISPSLFFYFLFFLVKNSDTLLFNQGRLSVLNYGKFFNLSLPAVLSNFSLMTTSYANTFALFGFFTLLMVSSQLITGTMLSFSLVPESMMVSLVRDEEDAEVLYIDDYF